MSAPRVTFGYRLSWPGTMTTSLQRRRAVDALALARIVVSSVTETSVVGFLEAEDKAHAYARVSLAVEGSVEIWEASS